MNKEFSTCFRIVITMLVLALTIFTNNPVHAVGEKIGLVTAEGGVADLSFNYMAYQGLLRAETDLGVVGTLYEPASSADYETELQQCVSDGNELCFAVGFGMADAINNVASPNPGTAFAILDVSFDSPPANLRGILFKEKEAGYLAGALAGKMTASGVIGVVGGMEVPAVVAFVEGYRNGAQCTGTNLNVLRNYTGSFNDPDLGAAVAEDMINRGADAIFGAAGATGNGAILYSTQHGVWGIGVDSDQYESLFENGAVLGADKLLTSAMKRLDVAVYETIEDYLGGTFSSETVTYDLAAGGVGLAPYHETDDDISPEVKDYIAGVQQGIIDSTIDINYPCEPRFHAEIVENDILAMDWLPGIAVTVTIDDPATGAGLDFTDTRNTDSNGFINFNNLGGLKLAPDMYISMTDGTITKYHTVTNLVVKGVNAASDTIWGTGDPGAYVNAQYCDDTGCSWRRWATVGPDGTWLTDFSVPGGTEPEEQNLLDIVPGMRGEALEPVDGGITDYQWYLPLIVTKKLTSAGAVDGWTLESSETSNKGSTMNNTATTFYLGDNAQKKQYRSVLSFSTKGLPDNAVITKVTLKVKKQGILGGGNPVNIFQGFMVDVRKGFFGSAAGLQVSDFQANANKSYGPFKPALSNGWYTLNLTPAKAYINKLATGSGVTQVRLRFKLDDNNNAVANDLSLYSGNAPIASRPQLIIEYYIP
jgi:basic membrane lipoprotein Med (substrate-binding protein (PBP1-ABC) superfamily)